MVHFEDGELSFSKDNMSRGAISLYLTLSLPILLATFAVYGWMTWRSSKLEKEKQE